MYIFNILDNANATLCEGILVPNELFNVVATINKGIKIVVPILLIIWGMLDFTKSVVAKKEEDIKKYQKAFVSRLISALVVFLIIFIVQLAVNLVSGVEDSTNSDGTTVSDIWSCSKKFINGVDTNDETEGEESSN